MLPVTGDLALVGTHVLRVEPDLGRQDNGPVDRGRRGWHLHHALSVRLHDRVPILVEPIPISDTHHTLLAARKHTARGVLQPHQLHDIITDRTTELITVRGTRRDRLTVLLIVHTDLMDQPIHLVTDLTGR